MARVALPGQPLYSVPVDRGARLLQLGPQVLDRHGQPPGGRQGGMWVPAGECGMTLDESVLEVGNRPRSGPGGALAERAQRKSVQNCRSPSQVNVGWAGPGVLPVHNTGDPSVLREHVGRVVVEVQQPVLVRNLGEPRPG